MECKFDKAWAGTCGVDNCKKHLNLKCSCGKKAVGECEFAESLVCGAYTCREGSLCHEHAYVPEQTETEIEYKRVIGLLEDDYGWLGLDCLTDIKKELIMDVIKATRQETMEECMKDRLYECAKCGSDVFLGR